MFMQSLQRGFRTLAKQVAMPQSWSLFSNLHTNDRTPEGYISQGFVEGSGYA